MPPSLRSADLRERLSAAGIALDRVVEQVTARPPTADEADTFDITIGVSMLSIQRTAIDTTGRVLEAAFLTCPATAQKPLTPQPASTAL
ncbi:UTRA domain-containing protein [Streptomyces johnsoniae]|uniref:UTRA domain-containing protein n=1 Tax=Streptomyces johnsoniae TaxID=3075532 RepID=A0ABU2SAQ1_9ACTN|nr:UTRA domain-containing protein [Streptomyces sp. DSM 41886]MDT0446051.1 UTRA domain-containing protein [Streptomyces sp. DSM 41886]